LPVYYALANAFVNPSKVEQWGLVVNEAMASGLPVMVSNRCGCVPELVREGINGYTFDPGYQRELCQRMTEMSNSPESELTRFGDESRKIVSNFGPERFATGLVQASEVARTNPPKRFRWVDRLLLTCLIYQ